MRAEAERLAIMVDDLFELSRIHSGTLQLSHDEIALDDLVSDVLASAEALARERGVRLAGRAAGQLTVRADPRELSRALTNLVTNAIRHTPPEGSVHVEARPDREAALLAVADGCGGIPEADLPHVFDLAWRGTDARSPAPDSGAGLGLAIVRGIVEAHRGSVRVLNTEGRVPLRDEAARLPLNASAERLALSGQPRSRPGGQAPPRTPRPPRRTARLPASRSSRQMRSLDAVTCRTSPSRYSPVTTGAGPP